MESLYKQPNKDASALNVVCPKCFAAIGGACMEPAKLSGKKYVAFFHEERIALGEKEQK